MSTSTATASVVVPGDAARVFAPVTRADPARFYPRFGPLPAVRAVRDQTGDWDAVGRTRTLELSDGGTVRERIDVVDPPRLFAYELSEFTGFFAALVASARAEWRFTDIGAATVVDWRYSFRARPGRGLVVAAIVRLAWAPYMRRVLPPLAAATAARRDSQPTPTRRPPDGG